MTGEPTGGMAKAQKIWLILFLLFGSISLSLVLFFTMRNSGDIAAIQSNAPSLDTASESSGALMKLERSAASLPTAEEAQSSTGLASINAQLAPLFALASACLGTIASLMGLVSATVGLRRSREQTRRRAEPVEPQRDMVASQAPEEIHIDIIAEHEPEELQIDVFEVQEPDEIQINIIEDVENGTDL